jgi:hypothetical protein
MEQAGRALDVREEERDGSPWKLRCHAACALLLPSGTQSELVSLGVTAPNVAASGSASLRPVSTLSACETATRDSAERLPSSGDGVESLVGRAALVVVDLTQ